MFYILSISPSPFRFTPGFGIWCEASFSPFCFIVFRRLGVMTGHRTLRWFCLCFGSSAMLPQQPNYEQTSLESLSGGAGFTSSASVMLSWNSEEQRTKILERLDALQQDLVLTPESCFTKKCKGQRLCLFVLFVWKSVICTTRESTWAITASKLMNAPWLPWVTINFKTCGQDQFIKPWEDNYLFSGGIWVTAESS